MSKQGGIPTRTEQAVRMHGDAPIVFQGKEWAQVNIGTNWVNNRNSYFVSLGSSNDRERLFFNQGSEFIKKLKEQALVRCKGKKTTEEKLAALNDLINEQTEIPGQSRDQVEGQLDKNLENYLKKHKAVEGHIDLNYETLAEAKPPVLVCRHKAILAASLMAHLVENKVLGNGNVRQYRSILFGNDGRVRGAHTWSVYRDSKTNELWICDPRWAKAKKVTPPDFKGVENYGKIALNEMVKRLDQEDKVKTPEAGMTKEQFEIKIQEATTIKQLKEAVEEYTKTNKIMSSVGEQPKEQVLGAIDSITSDINKLAELSKGRGVPELANITSNYRLRENFIRLANEEYLKQKNAVEAPQPVSTSSDERIALLIQLISRIETKLSNPIMLYSNKRNSTPEQQAEYDRKQLIELNKELSALRGEAKQVPTRAPEGPNAAQKLDMYEAALNKRLNVFGYNAQRNINMEETYAELEKIQELKNRKDLSPEQRLQIMNEFHKEQKSKRPIENPQDEPSKPVTPGPSDRNRKP